MNAPSLEKYENATNAGGVIIADNSLIEKKVERDDIESYYIPATKLASDENLPGLANMIMIGYMIKKTGVIPFENVEAAMKKVVSAKKQNLFELNMKAVRIGYDFEE